ncbi:hypothetical protein [Streptomyces sp. NPDC048644]|uniref:hypothetical protein n=1 Tax=Streptomyces sp. NPDC048644 TaxID=3365582 RepID=UPI0037233E0B
MTTDRIEEAESACEELAGALKEAGIVLPSLGVEAASYGYERAGVLVELGRCNLDTASRLIAVIKRATAR